MNRTAPSIGEWGLLAGGCSAHWSIDIDQLRDGEELNLQIAGSTLYLAFQLNDLNTTARMAEYLELGPSTEEPGLTIGRFGASTVTLRWDNEDFLRCFLTVGVNAQSTMHYNLYENDIKELVEILREIRSELGLD
jgi:hypothetical protein